MRCWCGVCYVCCFQDRDVVDDLDEKESKLETTFLVLWQSWLLQRKRPGNPFGSAGFSCQHYPQRE
ncbi:MAG: hypothetical protein O2856_20325, partial [Planctomycetota bacterium]|nr:hypothetical protein [Planctomycetota bacterium]